MTEVRQSAMMRPAVSYLRKVFALLLHCFNQAPTLLLEHNTCGMPSLSCHCCIKSNVSRWNWIPSSSCSDFQTFWHCAQVTLDLKACFGCPPRTRVLQGGCFTHQLADILVLEAFLEKTFDRTPMGIGHISAETGAHLTKTTLQSRPTCEQGSGGGGSNLGSTQVRTPGPRGGGGRGGGGEQQHREPGFNFFRVARTNAIHLLGVWVVKTVPLYRHI